MELYSEDPATITTLKWLSLPEAKWLVNSIVSKLPECRTAFAITLFVYSVGNS